jgi:hypothetical protein
MAPKSTDVLDFPISHHYNLIIYTAIMSINEEKDADSHIT